MFALLAWLATAAVRAWAKAGSNLPKAFSGTAPGAAVGASSSSSQRQPAAGDASTAATAGSGDGSELGFEGVAQRQVQVFVDHLHLLAIICCSTAVLSWPKALSTFVAVLGFTPLGTSRWVSLDCLLSRGPGSVSSSSGTGSGSGGVPAAMVYLLITAALPLLYLGIAAVWWIWVVARPPWGLGRPGRRSIIVVLVGWSLFYPLLTWCALSAFNCAYLDSPAEGTGEVAAAVGWYWMPDPGVQCFRGRHLGFMIGFGVPLLLLVGVGWPVVLGVVLHGCNVRLRPEQMDKPRGRLHPRVVAVVAGQVLGVIAGRFRLMDRRDGTSTAAVAAAGGARKSLQKGKKGRSMEFWLLVAEGRKLLLMVLLLALLPQQAEVQLYTVWGLLALFLVADWWVKPHASRPTGRLQLLSLGALLATAYLASAFNDAALLPASTCFVVLVILAHLLVVVVFLCGVLPVGYQQWLWRVVGVGAKGGAGKGVGVPGEIGDSSAKGGGHSGGRGGGDGAVGETQGKLTGMKGLRAIVSSRLGWRRGAAVLDASAAAASVDPEQQGSGGGSGSSGAGDAKGELDQGAAPKHGQHDSSSLNGPIAAVGTAVAVTAVDRSSQGLERQSYSSYTGDYNLGPSASACGDSPRRSADGSDAELRQRSSSPRKHLQHTWGSSPAPHETGHGVRHGRQPNGHVGTASSIDIGALGALSRAAGGKVVLGGSAGGTVGNLNSAGSSEYVALEVNQLAAEEGRLGRVRSRSKSGSVAAVGAGGSLQTRLSVLQWLEESVELVHGSGHPDTSVLVRGGSARGGAVRAGEVGGAGAGQQQPGIPLRQLSAEMLQQLQQQQQQQQGGWGNGVGGAGVAGAAGLMRASSSPEQQGVGGHTGHLASARAALVQQLLLEQQAKGLEEVVEEEHTETWSSSVPPYPNKQQHGQGVAGTGAFAAARAAEAAAAAAAAAARAGDIEGQQPQHGSPAAAGGGAGPTGRHTSYYQLWAPVADSIGDARASSAATGQNEATAGFAPKPSTMASPFAAPAVAAAAAGFAATAVPKAAGAGAAVAGPPGYGKRVSPFAVPEVASVATGGVPAPKASKQPSPFAAPEVIAAAAGTKVGRGSSPFAAAGALAALTAGAVHVANADKRASPFAAPAVAGAAAGKRMSPFAGGAMTAAAAQQQQAVLTPQEIVAQIQQQQAAAVAAGAAEPLVRSAQQQHVQGTAAVAVAHANGVPPSQSRTKVSPFSAAAAGASGASSMANMSPQQILAQIQRQQEAAVAAGAAGAGVVPAAGAPGGATVKRGVSPFAATASVTAGTSKVALSPEQVMAQIRQQQAAAVAAGAAEPAAGSIVQQHGREQGAAQAPTAAGAGKVASKKMLSPFAAQTVAAVGAVVASPAVLSPKEILAQIQQQQEAAILAGAAEPAGGKAAFQQMPQQGGAAAGAAVAGKGPQPVVKHRVSPFGAPAVGAVGGSTAGLSPQEILAQIQRQQEAAIAAGAAVDVPGAKVSFEQVPKQQPQQQHGAAGKPPARKQMVSPFSAPAVAASTPRPGGATANDGVGKEAKGPTAAVADGFRAAKVSPVALPTAARPDMYYSMWQGAAGPVGEEPPATAAAPSPGSSYALAKGSLSESV